MKISCLKYAAYPVLWALFLVGSLIAFMLTGLGSLFEKWFS